jgi:hypothetical protein
MSTSNPSAGEAEAGESKIQYQPGLHSEVLSQKKFFFKFKQN